MKIQACVWGVECREGEGTKMLVCPPDTVKHLCPSASHSPVSIPLDVLSPWSDTLSS